MILQDWLKELDYTLIQGNPDTQVEEVIYDSRKAGPGTVFVAMTGTRIDAHCFIPDVLKAGTRILVTERPIDMELEACELDEEEKKKILEAGMNYHLSKPINPKTLYNILSNHLTGKEA